MIPPVLFLDDVDPAWVDEAQRALTAVQQFSVQRAAMTMATGWTPYGGGWSDPQVSKFGRIVIMSGLAKVITATKTAPSTIGTIPSAFWPRPVGSAAPLGGRLIFPGLYTGNNFWRLDVSADGNVVMQEGPNLAVGAFLATSGMWVTA